MALNTISIASVKGGCGKSFFAMNLAKLIAESNFYVLLVDLDFTGGGLSKFLNVDHTKQTIYSILTQKNIPLNDFTGLIKSSENLTRKIGSFNNYFTIIPSNHYQPIVNFFEWSIFNKNLIKLLISAYQLGYHYVIFDCPVYSQQLTIRTCSFSNVAMLMREDNLLSAEPFLNLKQTILNEYNNILKNFKMQINDKDIEYDWLKKWQATIYKNRKKLFFLLNKSANQNKTFMPPDHWVIKDEEEVKQSFHKGSTVVPENLFNNGCLNDNIINTHYLHTLLKIYKQIIECSGIRFDGLYWIDEKNELIEENICNYKISKKEKAISVKEEKYYKLQNLLKIKNKTIQSLQKSIKTIWKDNQTAREELRRMDDFFNNENEINIGKLLDENEYLRKELTEKYEKNEKKYNNLKKKKEKLVKTKQNLENQLSKRKINCNNLENETKKIKKEWQEKYQKILEECKNLKNNNQTMKEDWINKIKILKKEIENKNKIYKKIKQEYEQFHGEKCNSEEKKQKLVKENKNLHHRLQESAEVYCQLKEEYDKIIQEKKETEKKLQNLEKLVDQKMQAYSDLHLDYEEKQKRYKEICQKYATLQEQTSDPNHITADFEKVKKEKDSLLLQFQKIDQSYQTLHKEYEKLQNKYNVQAKKYQEMKNKYEE